MIKTVLVKPIITEKAEMLSENLNRYSFVVNRKAKKAEVKKAVEEMYDVKVLAVNTMIMPAKLKSRMTKSGLLKGKVSAYKKAIVTIPEGEEIDFYGEI